MTDFQQYTVQQSAPTSTGIQSFVVTGAGTLKGAIIKASFADAVGSPRDDAGFSVGFVDGGGDHFCGGFTDNHAAAVTEAETYGDEFCVMLTDGNGTTLWKADLAGLTTDGLRLNWTVVQGSNPILVQATLFYGDDVTVDITNDFQAPGTIGGTTVVNTLSITSQVVVGFHIGNASFNGTPVPDADFGMGFWENGGEGRSKNIFSDDGSGSSDNGENAGNFLFARVPDTGNVDGEIDLESFTSTGFTMRCSGGIQNISNYSCGLMGITLSGVSTKVGSAVVPDTEPGRLAITGLGFVPGSALFLTGEADTLGSTVNATSAWSFMVGDWQQVNSQHSVSCQSEDNQGTMDTQSLASDTTSLFTANDSGTDFTIGKAVVATHDELHLFFTGIFSGGGQQIAYLVFEQVDRPGAFSFGGEKFVTALPAAETGLASPNAKFYNECGDQVEQIDLTEGDRTAHYYGTIPADLPCGTYYVDVEDSSTFKQAEVFHWAGPDHGGAVNALTQQLTSLQGSFVGSTRVSASGGTNSIDVDNIPSGLDTEGLDGMSILWLGGNAPSVKGATNMAVRRILDYNTSTNVLTLDRDLPANASIDDLIYFLTDTGWRLNETAEGNLEDQFDGTGLAGDSFPSSQAQLSNIAITGSAVNAAADSFTLTTGSTVSGDESDTASANGVYHRVEDTGGTLDLYYEFDIGGDGLPSSVSFIGRLNGSNDELTIQARNFGASTWEDIGALSGSGGSTDETVTISLLTRHVGTGADIGKVRIRFFDNGLSSADLYVDQLLVSFSVANRSVGYANGAIWIDTNNGVAGVEAFVNGTADNPVSSLADAITLSTALNITRFQMVGGSTITLSQGFTSFTFLGSAFYTLNLNGQAINGCRFSRAVVSGIATGSDNIFDGCEVGVATVGPCMFESCGFTSTLTLGSAGDYFLIRCYSEVPGTSSPTIDYNGVDADVSVRKWSGGVTLNNITSAGSVSSYDLDPGTVTVSASCTNGQVNIRGVGVANNNSTGSCDVVVTSLVKANQLDQLFFGSAVAIDANNGTSGVIFPQGTPGNPVDNVSDARTIADGVGDNGVRSYDIIGTITLAGSHTDWFFNGTGGSTSRVNLGGQNVSGAKFQSLNVQGTMVAETGIVEVRNGPMGNIAGFRGSVVECGIFGTWAFGTAARTQRFVRCQQGNTEPVFDCTNLNTTAIFALYDGAITFDNLSSGQTIVLDSSGGADVTLGAGCTGGDLVIRGMVRVIDNSGGSVTIESGTVVSSDSVADAVLNELIADHTASGSVGETLAFIVDNLDTFRNRATVVEEGGGTKLVTIFESDDSTVKYQVRISADGLTRTRV